MKVKNVENIYFIVIFFAKILHSFADEFESTQIILYYAPMGESKHIRGQIVIYWYVEEFMAGDILALHHDADDECLFSFYPKEISGHVKTGVSAKKRWYQPDRSFIEQCTGYRGSWFRNGTKKKSSCLSTHPDWMGKHYNILANLTLVNLFIPGTHSSGSYEEEVPPTIIQRYTITQDSSIMNQLISGVRYLDLRPCIVDRKYWACHGSFLIRPFEEIINHIETFLDNTMEIVIVSFKEFPKGFHTEEDHEDFLMYIQSRLSKHIFLHSLWSTVTLGNMWEKNKRLLLSYHADSSNGRIKNPWAMVVHQWGDVQNIAELDGFITNTENKARNSRRSKYLILRAVMAEITLDSSMIIADAATYYFGRGKKSLRELAVETGPLITMWYNEEYFSTANIVAVDFIDATGLVEVAIRSNLVRAAQYA